MIVARTVVAVSVINRAMFVFTNVVAGIFDRTRLNDHDRRGRRRANLLRWRINHWRTRNDDGRRWWGDHHGWCLIAMIIAN